jgi:putative hydrolase
MDLHVHSEYSHGKGSIQEIIKAGIARHLDFLAITEHVRSQSPWFETFLSDIQTSRKGQAINVFSGIESKVLDFNGKLDATEKMIQTAELVVASVHRIPSVHNMNGELTLEKINQNKAHITDLYLQALGGIASNPKIDIVGHPFHLLKAIGVERVTRDRKIEIAKLFSTSKKAVEVNSCYRVPDLEFLKICLKEGVKISIGSDAHRIEDVGNVKWSTRLLEKAGGTAKDIIDVECILASKDNPEMRSL